MAKGRKGNLTRRAVAPLKHTVAAAGNTVKEIGGTAKNLFMRTLNGVRRIGSAWTRHAQMAVNNVRGKKQRGGKRKGTRRGARRH